MRLRRGSGRGLGTMIVELETEFVLGYQLGLVVGWEVKVKGSL
jgi:hypothetical protein